VPPPLAKAVPFGALVPFIVRNWFLEWWILLPWRIYTPNPSSGCMLEDDLDDDVIDGCALRMASDLGVAFTYDTLGDCEGDVNMHVILFGSCLAHVLGCQPCSPAWTSTTKVRPPGHGGRIHNRRG
jgi:hypothetical protein